MKDETLSVEGYQWFGKNWDSLHVNARKGSGGGFLIINDLLNHFNVCKLNSLFEGILWLSLKSKTDSVNFNICVCYLSPPPLNSSRQIDALKFYDCHLANIYEYQNHGRIFICGNLNGRCGDMVDFIEGIDDLGFRETKLTLISMAIY